MHDGAGGRGGGEDEGEDEGVEGRRLVPEEDGGDEAAAGSGEFLVGEAGEGYPGEDGDPEEEGFE